MKHLKYRLIVVFMLTVSSLYAQNTRLNGAWKVTNTQGLPPGAQVIYLMSDSYFVSVVFNEKDKQFFGILGGTYRTEANKLTGTLEFNSVDSTAVGSSQTFTFSQSADGKTTYMESSYQGQTTTDTLAYIETVGTTSLTGLWRFAGRVDAAGNEFRSQRGPRKTIKLLTGNHFVWAAINTETKQFFGCGGGKYTVQDGKYTENIYFFSRDNSRVGASLTFDCQIKDKEWHHKGKNSKGEPLYEIWALD
jgi:hypothetical protein